MKKLRAMVLSLMVGATVFLGMGNWAIAAKPGGGYVYTDPTVLVEFSTGPCVDPAIVARTKPEFVGKQRAGLVSLATGEKVVICWVEHEGFLYFIGAETEVMRLDTDHPRLRRTNDI